MRCKKAGKSRVYQWFSTLILHQNVQHTNPRQYTQMSVATLSIMQKLPLMALYLRENVRNNNSHGDRMLSHKQAMGLNGVRLAK